MHVVQNDYTSKCYRFGVYLPTGDSPDQDKATDDGDSANPEMSK